MTKTLFLSAALTAMVLVLPVGVFAQETGTADGVAPPPAEEVSTLGLTKEAAKLDPSAVPPEVRILRRIERELKKKQGKEVLERSSVPSLVFTPDQYAMLRDARIGFNARIPSLEELKGGIDPNDPNATASGLLRDIHLGGIAFLSPDDWTIWLNNKLVTPDNLPKEAVDLRVYKDFIEMKWFDLQTNQVFPVRLRANQKFNLDSRVFLPG